MGILLNHEAGLARGTVLIEALSITYRTIGRGAVLALIPHSVQILSQRTFLAGLSIIVENGSLVARKLALPCFVVEEGPIPAVDAVGLSLVRHPTEAVDAPELTRLAVFRNMGIGLIRGAVSAGLRLEVIGLP